MVAFLVRASIVRTQCICFVCILLGLFAKFLETHYCNFVINTYGSELRSQVGRTTTVSYVFTQMNNSNKTLTQNHLLNKTTG